MSRNIDKNVTLKVLLNEKPHSKFMFTYCPHEGWYLTLAQCNLKIIKY